ncbi:hypothetical protein [Haloferax sulfurifontis]|uniref:SWIM-type domain-containing protein n=2 Tax=Haloferax sulfurifontis TaxID=255616 RepID=M0IIF2_9EURY|nr:hypothetical protein [Haloferax sulfurifontis]ELZ96551.1 hypothetical protein C441_04264 [Haloferax sulfurifontis ATCC BAA-897]GGC72183.1 hypothetical protein GCM10007209_37640 [Haloferax sulfurifontis]
MAEPNPTESDELDSFEPRTVRALTERMTVYAQDPDAWSDSEAAVYSSSTQYIVSFVEGQCNCDDSYFRRAKCKHQRRAAFALGIRDIPEDFPEDRIDPLLLKRVRSRGQK